MKQTTAVISFKPAIYKQIILGVGAATFFFGFFAGALLNIFLIAVHSPLVTQLRTTLTYKSAIFGDGIILPIVNMFAVSFILKHQKHVTKKTLITALCLGLGITAYFHITQALGNIVNWAMPSPWHWNFIGYWHAVYMFSVCSLLSLYYVVLFHSTKKKKRLTRESFIVTLGIIFFFLLLHLDYLTINLKASFVNDVKQTKVAITKGREAAFKDIPFLSAFVN